MRMMLLLFALALAACAQVQNREQMRLAWQRCVEVHSQAHDWLDVCR